MNFQLGKVKVAGGFCSAISGCGKVKYVKKHLSKPVKTVDAKKILNKKAALRSSKIILQGFKAVK